MDINLFFMAILVVCNIITTTITLATLFADKKENHQVAKASSKTV